jgi:hypothetical protein
MVENRKKGSFWMYQLHKSSYFRASLIRPVRLLKNITGKKLSIKTGKDIEK